MLHPEDFTVVDGSPVTSVARTLLDLAAVLRPPDLEAALDRAERLRIFDLSAVVEVLDRAKGRKGARTLRRVVAAYEPSTQKSELERRCKALLETAPDIPRPSVNALVDGETECDAASDADLELVGHRVMRLTWDDVSVNAERTLRCIRLALGVS